MSQGQFNITITNAPKQAIDYKVKFKTEMCRNWKLGCCEFGDQCMFAHGHEELRSVSSSSYRTKKCKQFYEKGYCQYGNRCQFKHRDISQETAANSPRIMPRQKSEEASKRRLPVFLRIAPHE